MWNKNVDLNRWLWKWHVIAGLITMPFMLILAITGVIYLFKADVNEQLYRSTLYVEAPNDSTVKLGYSEQLSAAMRYSNNHISAISIPTDSCLLYTSPSPRDQRGSRMPSSA